MKIKERRATASAYLDPVLKKAPRIDPVSAGFFAGRLNYYKLSLFQKLYVKMFIGAEEGDYRNWKAIREWAVEFKTTHLIER